MFLVAKVVVVKRKVPISANLLWIKTRKVLSSREQSASRLVKVIRELSNVTAEAGHRERLQYKEVVGNIIIQVMI